MTDSGAQLIADAIRYLADKILEASVTAAITYPEAIEQEFKVEDGDERN